MQHEQDMLSSVQWAWCKWRKGWYFSYLRVALKHQTFSLTTLLYFRLYLETAICRTEEKCRESYNVQCLYFHDFFSLRKLTFADSWLWSCFTLTISFYQLKALSFYNNNLTYLSGNWHIQIKVTHSLLDWDDHTAKVDFLFTSPRQWQQVQHSFLTVGDRSASRLSPFQEKILWCLIS